MTNGVRVELAGKGILVQGVHLGAADTDLMAGRTVPGTTLPRLPERAWPASEPEPSRCWSTPPHVSGRPLGAATLRSSTADIPRGALQSGDAGLTMATETSVHDTDHHPNCTSNGATGAN